jgi:ribokinase
LFRTSFEKNFGGKGANQALQCARLGVKTVFCGCVGGDSLGDEYITQLRIENVEAIMKQSNNQGTGVASITVDEGGQNTIVIVQGANLSLTKDEIISREEILFQNSKVLICQNEIPYETTKESLVLAKKYQLISIFNPAPYTKDIEKSLIELCDIVCPNELELSSLTGLATTTNEEIKIAAEFLLSFGCKAVIVTLGSRGAFLAQKSSINNGHEAEFFEVENKVNAIDTVGAGDSFIGFLFFLFITT